jgi:uncharacterized NAD(P)/FAD-binding protein YdhS
VVDQTGITGDSYRDELESWYTPLNAFVSIGPPARRIAELTALMEAGVVRVLGPGMRVRASPERRAFVVDSPRVTGSETEVTALVDARLPETDVRRTTDPLLRGLLTRGECRVYDIPSSGGAAHTSGGLAVTPRPYRLVDASGVAHPHRFAFGVPTESVHWGTAASVRPGVDSVILGDADAIARACLGLVPAR